MLRRGDCPMAGASNVIPTLIQTCSLSPRTLHSLCRSGEALRLFGGVGSLPPRVLLPIETKTPRAHERLGPGAPGEQQVGRRAHPAATRGVARCPVGQHQHWGGWLPLHAVGAVRPSRPAGRVQDR